MRTLLLVRHAKSGWDPMVPGDFERTLNDRGNRDAPEMARRLKKDNISLDMLVSSPAIRAKQTALHFGKVLNIPPSEVVLLQKLYEPSVEAFYLAVTALPEFVSTVAVFSHNPGITDFVNTLTDTKIDDMPTCGIFAVQTDIPSWNGFRDVEKQFLFFKYPKEV